MRIFKMVLVILVAVMVLAGLLTAVCVKLYLAPHTIQHSIQTSLEHHLHRNVSIATVEKESLRRITLRDVTIHPSHPGETAVLITCPQISLKIGLLPLIARQLLIKDIVVHNPSAVISLSQHGGPRHTGTGVAGSPATPVLSLLVLPERFLLDNGRVTFADPLQDTLISLDGVSLRADPISLLSPFSFSGSARLNNDPDATLTLSGTASALQRTLTADVSLPDLDLEQLGRLTQRYGIPVRQGRFAGAATIISDFSERLEISGTADIREAEIVLIPQLQVSLQKAPASVRFSSTYDFTQQVLDITAIEGTLFSSPFSGSGNLRTRRGATRISGTLHAPSFSLDNLCALIRQPPDSPLSGLRLGGTMDITARVDTATGRPVAPLCILEFTGNQLFYPGLGAWVPEIRGTVRIDEKAIRLAQFKVGTDNLSITLAGDLSDYLSGSPRSSIHIIASRADFPELFSGTENEIGPFALGSLALSGPINLGSIVFLGMRLDAVQGSYALENNTLTIHDISGSIGEGGWFSLQASTDLGVQGLDYHLLLRVTDASMEPLAAFFPGAPPGLLRGRVSGTCALKGAGTVPRLFTDNLRGDADLVFHDIILREIKLLPELSRFIRPEALSALEFSQAQLHLQLRSGVVDLTGYLAGPHLELYPQGEIGLDAALDLTADLLIAPGIFSDAMRIAHFLPHRGDQVSLPVTIRGTLMEPRLGLAEETIQYLIRETLPRLLLDILSTMQEESPEEAGEKELRQ